MNRLFKGLAIAASALGMTAATGASSMNLLRPAPDRLAPFVEEAGGIWHPWNTVEAQALSGRETRLRLYYLKCTIGGEGLPAFSATASHGTVTIKEGSYQACGRKVPTFEIWYQSEPGFHGLDEILVTPQYEAIDVTVR